MNRSLSIAAAALAAAAACKSPEASCPPESMTDAPVVAATPDAAPPVADDGRFTLVVIPDTQYLFDSDRGDPAVLAASLQWIVDHTADRHIVFTAGLGDIVENHAAAELAAADDAYRLLDDHHVAYSLVAGNHDLSNSSQYDDQRGAEAYLDHFAPSRYAGQASFGGASPTGYDHYSIFEGGGQQWLLLALDWRASASSIAWAKDVIHAHPALPVIVTTHELVYDGGDGVAALSDYGQSVWDNLISGEDQIFLTVNGHFWPPARGVRANAKGHDVHMHLANYQDRYYGGSGMIRTYQFDLARGTIEASTFSPFVAALPVAERNPLARQELELADARNRFIEQIDFAARFRDFQGGAPPPPPPLPVDKVVVPGTVAYWRFDGGTPSTPVPATGVAVPDLSGHGNDLQRVTLSGGTTNDLVWSSEYDPSQPAHASLFFHGSKTNPAFGGAYLRTADGAPMNALTFPGGYTIEAFIRLPDDCCESDHAWMGVVSRLGTGGDAGKIGDDPDEPVGTLTVAPGRGMQWAIRPTNTEAMLTSWGHQMHDTWDHVAVVNDGHKSVLYVNGAPILRNPRAESVGISTAGKPWLIGATHYADIVEQSFYGWLGDVRIVDHALTVDQFMTAR